MNFRCVIGIAIGFVACSLPVRAAVLTGIVKERISGREDRPLKDVQLRTACGDVVSLADGKFTVSTCQLGVVETQFYVLGKDYRLVSPIKTLLNTANIVVIVEKDNLATGKDGSKTIPQPPATPQARGQAPRTEQQRPQYVVEVSWSEKDSATTLTMEVKSNSAGKGTIRDVTLYVSRSWQVRHAIQPLPEASQSAGRELVLAEAGQSAYSVPIPTDGLSLDQKIAKTVGVLSRVPVNDWVFELQVAARVEKGGQVVAAVTEPFLMFISGRRMDAGLGPMRTMPTIGSDSEGVRKSQVSVSSIPTNLRFYDVIEKRLGEFANLKLADIIPGKTLAQAASVDSAAGVAALLLAGSSADLVMAAISPTDETGPPLVLAAGGKTGDSIKVLLEHGAQYAINGQPIHTSAGDTPFIRAARVGNYEGLKVLLEGVGRFAPDVDVALLDAVTSNGETALTLSSGRQDLESAELLLAHGFLVGLHPGKTTSPPSVSVRDTALVHALRAGCGNQQIVELLLNNGSEADAGVEASRAPLTIAARAGCGRIVERLLMETAAIPAVWEAWKAAWASTAMDPMRALLRVEPFLAKLRAGSADANGPNQILYQDFRDLFRVAVSKDKPFATELLIGIGTGPEDFLQLKIDCFAIAIAGGAKGAVTSMLRSGKPFSDIALDSKGGDSAVMLAIDAGRPEIVKVLKDFGAKPNVPKGSVTKAVESQLLESLEAVLLAGGDPNEDWDGGGRTPLVAVVASLSQLIRDDLSGSNIRERQVRLLLEYCADPGLSRNGLTSVERSDVPNSGKALADAKLLKIIRETPKPTSCPSRASP